MKNIPQKKTGIQSRQIRKLTKAIKNAPPARALELISEAITTAQNHMVKQWPLNFKTTFEGMQGGGKWLLMQKRTATHSQISKFQ
jgi:hypothetical protein